MLIPTAPHRFNGKTRPFLPNSGRFPVKLTGHRGYQHESPFLFIIAHPQRRDREKRGDFSKFICLAEHDGLLPGAATPRRPKRKGRDWAGQLIKPHFFFNAEFDEDTDFAIKKVLVP